MEWADAAPALESQAAEQRVGFHDMRQRRSHDFLLAGCLGCHAVFQDRVVAQAGETVPGQRAQSAALIRTVGLSARIGLEPRGQGISHSRDQESYRCHRDNPGIDQDQLWIAGQEQVTREGTFRRVNHRDGAGRGVRRSDRRHNAYAGTGLVSDRLCRIDNLTAAHPDHDLAGLLLGDLRQPFDFLVTAFTAEPFDG